MEGQIADFELPKVSVVIPTYNRPDATRRAVESVLNQDFTFVHEIIVVDDGSDDGAQLSPVLEEKAVRIIRHDRNRGAASARNSGIEAATGEWIALLDSDDVWLPTKLKQQFAFMDRIGVPVSCTGVTRCSPARSETIIRPYPEMIGFEHLVWGCHVSPGSTMVAEKVILEQLGGYDATLERLEDWDLLLRMAQAGIVIGYLPVALSVIERSESPDRGLVQASIDMIEAKHRRYFEDRGRKWGRYFGAARRFERGVAWWHAGHRIRATADIGLSWVSAPWANLPVRLQLSAVKNRLRRRGSSPGPTA